MGQKISFAPGTGFGQGFLWITLPLAVAGRAEMVEWRFYTETERECL